jgi:hypothetical protein
MRKAKLNMVRSEKGFTLAGALVAAGLVGVAGLVFAQLMADTASLQKKAVDKSNSVALASEVRSIVNLEGAVGCTSTIVKRKFDYPGLTSDGSIRRPASADTGDEGIPVDFDFGADKKITESAGQTTKVQVTKLRFKDAIFIGMNGPDRVYAGNLVLQTKAGNKPMGEMLLAPLDVGGVNITVNPSSNQITGCYGASGAEGLCKAMGGQYAGGSCTLASNGCQTGETWIYDENAGGRAPAARCRSMRRELASVCPPDHYLVTNSDGTDLTCLGIGGSTTTGDEEVITVDFPDRCTSGRNGSCSLAVNFKDRMPADKRSKEIRGIRLVYRHFQNFGDGECRGAVADLAYSPAGGGASHGMCGRKCALSSASVDTSSGAIAMASVTGGWGDCGGNPCNACISNIQAIITVKK